MDTTARLSVLLMCYMTFSQICFGQLGEQPGAPRQPQINKRTSMTQPKAYYSAKAMAAGDSLYRTSFFTFTDIAVFSYFDSTKVSVIQGSTTIATFDLVADTMGSYSVSQGVYRLVGNKPFTVLVGDAITRYVNGYFAIDASGLGVSTKFNTWMMYSEAQAYDPHFIVFGYQNGTQFTIRDLNTKQMIAAGTLNAGQYYDFPNITSISDLPLQVTSNLGVSVLSYTDQDYYVPSSNGTFSGTVFYGFSGYSGGWSNSITVTSYVDDNHVVVTDLNTGAKISDYVLGEGQVYSDTINADTFWKVQSTGTVTVADIPYAGWTGNYAYLARAADFSGRNMGTLFYVPTISSRLDVFSYDDNNSITITRLGLQSEYPYLAKTVVYSGLAMAGDVATIAQTEYGNYVYRVDATKNVSVLQSYSEAGADFMPLNYALQMADLSVSSGDIAFTPPDSVYSAGDTITVAVTVHNQSTVDAISVDVALYDGDPDAGGIAPLFGTKTITSVFAGSTAIAVFQIVVPAQPEYQMLFVKVDPNNRVTESNKSNNKAFRSFKPNSDLLPPLPVTITAPNGLVRDASTANLSPNPFTIQADIFNSGSVAALDVHSQLALLNGLLRVSGPSDSTLGVIPAGGVARVVWSVLANSDSVGLNLFSVTVTGSNALPKIVKRGIYVPPEGQLTRLTDGPHPDSIDVPENGIGYVYFRFTSQGNPVFSSSALEVTLTKDASQVVTANSIFLEPGTLRVAIPSSLLGNSPSIFLTPSVVTVDGTAYAIQSGPVTFVARPTPLSFTRTFDFYAGGSAGISGSLGAVGLGVSVAAAKLSVDGEAGMGLQLRLDQDNILTLERRFDAGIGASLQAPSINPGITGVVNVLAGVHANIIDKGTIGQSMSFTKLPIDANTIMMAQTGYILETLSLGGVGLGPMAAPLLSAIVSTLSLLSGISQVYESALVSQYWGLGIEGSCGAGFTFNVGDIEGSALDQSVGFVLDYKATTGYQPAASPLSKFYRRSGIPSSSREFSQAFNYQFSLLSFDLPFNDKVPLKGTVSLFDIGIGGETKYRASFGPNGEATGLSFGLQGGGDAALLGRTRDISYETTVAFPVEYAPYIQGQGYGISGLYSSGVHLPIGLKMTTDAVGMMNDVVKHFQKTPLHVTTTETRGQGFKFDIGIDPDVDLGVGLGLSLGIKGQYQDDIQYTKKCTDIYSGRKNYLLFSGDYDNVMEQTSITEVLSELFSGTIPLVKQAFMNLLNSIEQTVDAGIRFLTRVADRTGQFVGNVEGVAQNAGKFVLSVFSPNSPRIFPKAFEVPQVKNMYSSTDVQHWALGRSGVRTLQSVNTTLILVSQAMVATFYPQGSTVPLDSLSSPVSVTMRLTSSQLSNAGFSDQDKSRVRVYRYDRNTHYWVNEGGALSGDSVKTSVTNLGTFSLGIEVTDSLDTTPPDIYEMGPQDGSVQTSYPEIYAKIRDDRYGVGINLGQTLVIVNNDTVSALYDPTNQKLFYQLSSSDNMSNGMMSVRIIAADLNDNYAQKSFTFNLNVTGVKGQDDEIRDYILYQNYPNPFNPSTQIRFAVPASSDVQINIYNIEGRFVRQLFDGRLERGYHNFEWDGKNHSGVKVSSGTYFCQLKAGAKNMLRKMLLLR